MKRSVREPYACILLYILASADVVQSVILDNQPRAYHHGDKDSSLLRISYRIFQSHTADSDTLHFRTSVALDHRSESKYNMVDPAISQSEAAISKQYRLALLVRIPD